VTGGTGFLGRQIVEGCRRRGEDVTVLGLEELPDTPTMVVDLTQPGIDLGEKSFDVVYHLAGLAHFIPKTDDDARKFFDVNVEGTKNLLSALSLSEPPEAILFVSTVAVYGLETGEMIAEDQARQATDPYGLSKIDAEDVLHGWATGKNTRLSILRLPLVAGPNPVGNLGAMVSALKARRYVNIAGGRARRSMVLARDVADAMPLAADHGGTYHLTDGHHPSFAELSSSLAGRIGVRQPGNLPKLPAHMLAAAGDALGWMTRKEMPFNSRKLGKMSASFTFSDEAAREQLKWSPSRVVDHPQDVVG